MKRYEMAEKLKKELEELLNEEEWRAVRKRAELLIDGEVFNYERVKKMEERTKDTLKKLLKLKAYKDAGIFKDLSGRYDHLYSVFILGDKLAFAIAFGTEEYTFNRLVKHGFLRKEKHEPLRLEDLIELTKETYKRIIEKRLWLEEDIENVGEIRTPPKEETLENSRKMFENEIKSYEEQNKQTNSLRR